MFLLAGCTDVAQEIGLVEKEVGGPAGPAPRTNFEMNYDSQAGQVTVVHNGGAKVPASNVYIRGTGLEQKGSWIDLGGDTTTGAGGQEIIEAGDSLSLGAAPDFSGRVEWDTGDNTRVYTEATGPEA